MTEKKMQLVDWLDDLCVRFIINLPREELESVERICFQVEEAQWFYEDFIRPLDPDLPSLNLRNFCLLIFQHCPMLSTYSSQDHAQAFSEFLAYKTRVPVRGAILLNNTMDQVLLVKGWKKGANWSFPRGKINKDEPDLDCAIREVYEETGYDVKSAGLVTHEEKTKYIEMNLREQHMRLYVFRDVPMDTFFEPRTRKEISKIQWWKLSDLPTLKKKKQQQDGQVGDLAINANKFYMVAPFLPQLKKWISAQRKMDKTRQASNPAAITTVTDEEPIFSGDHATSKRKPQHPTNGDMGKLLEGLRQSAQPVQPSNLPEVMPPAVAEQDVAAQLKSFLGVPTRASMELDTAERPPAPGLINNPKANSLLALLQSEPVQRKQIPQTPMEQVVDHPGRPSSPSHPHHQPQRFSSMPPPPTFPTRDQMAMITSQQLQPPQICAIEFPHQPAQLVPRNPLPQSNKPQMRLHKDQHTRAPYQRTGDPQFAEYTQVPGNQSPIPPASKLPPPKLNAQTTALLSLFKANLPKKGPEDIGNGKASVRSSEQELKAATTLNNKQISGVSRSSAEPGGRATARDKSRQTPPLTNMLVPSQVLPTDQSDKGMDGSDPKLKHHDKLLSLFRNNSPATTEPLKPVSTTLQLPSTPVELSALPVTPGHSRDPSRNDEIAEGLASPMVQSEATKSRKYSLRSVAKSPNPPVSATISGPLNVPQFDMVAQTSKEARQALSKKQNIRQVQRSPIQILARPTSSNGQPQSTPARENASTVKLGKSGAPKLQTLVTPAEKPPPTPDLKGHEAPPKPFHPQILRRPANPDDSNEPSPIQPLPSPKHISLANRRPTQPADHKKSLLSLFTKASPAVSPPSAPVTSTVDPSALISPMTGPSPQEQADAAFARLSNDVGQLSQDPKPVPGPPQLPTLKTRTHTTTTNETTSRRNSGQYTSAVKTTPVDKAFLLGFLNRVAQSGR